MMMTQVYAKITRFIICKVVIKMMVLLVAGRTVLTVEVPRQDKYSKTINKSF